MSDLSKLSDEQLNELEKQLRSGKGLSPEFQSFVVAPGPQAKQEESTLLGPSKALGTGLVEGTASIAGLPGDFGEVMNNVTGVVPPEGTAHLPTSQELLAKLPKLYQGKPGLERVFQTAGQLGPGALLAPEALTARAPLAFTRFAAAPAAAAEGASALTDKFAPQYGQEARMAAMVLAPGMARKAITPFPANPEDMNMVRTLRGAGVTSISPSQYSPGAERFLSKWPGIEKHAAKVENEQAGQFGRYSLSHLGLDQERAPPGGGDLARVATATDTEFNRLTAQHSMPISQPVQNELNAALREYHTNNRPGSVSAEPAAVVQDIVNWANAQRGVPGFISGRQYQNLRAELGQLAGSAPSPALARLYGRMQTALDDGMEHTLSISAPHDVGAFQHARNMYQNQNIMEKALAKSGPEAASGLVTPKNLSSALRSTEGTRDFARGTNPMTEVARSGEAIMRPITTASEKSDFLSLMPLAGAFSGELIGNHILGHHGLAAGGGFGIAAPFVGGAAGAVAKKLAEPLVFNPASLRYIGNQLVPKVPLSADRAQQLLTARVLLGDQKPKDQVPVPVQ